MSDAGVSASTRDMVATESRLDKNVLELAARHLGVGANSLLATRLTGDASTRSYFRVASAERLRDGVTSDPPSVVVALYSAPFDEREPAASRLARLEAEDPAARLSFANDPCAHIEVTRLFLDAGLPVPGILKVSGSDRVLLIEDVGDTRLQDLLSVCDAGRARNVYERALDFIVRLQEVTASASRSICSRLAFDEAKLLWELEFFFENFFRHYLKREPDRATAGAVRREFRGLSRELSAAPRVLVHRDYHARNLMIHGDNIFIIDHQDARMGPVSYDVASLLGDPYAALAQQARCELLDYFVGRKKECDESLDVSTFLVEYEMMMLQRMLKAIGTYAYQAAVLKNAVYLPYMKPAIDLAISSAKSLGRFPIIGALLEETRHSRVDPQPG